MKTPPPAPLRVVPWWTIAAATLLTTAWFALRRPAAPARAADDSSWTEDRLRRALAGERVAVERIPSAGSRPIGEEPARPGDPTVVSADPAGEPPGPEPASPAPADAPLGGE